MNMMTAIVPATDAASVTWEEAVERYRALHAATNSAGNSDDEVATLADLMTGAFKTLVATPAPDAAALMQKIDMFEQDCRDWWHHDQADQLLSIRADVARLTAVETGQIEARNVRG